MPLSAGDLEVEQDRASAVLPHYPDLARKTPRLRRGKLLISREAVVELIASTTTRAGLTVRCELDTRDYPKGIKVSDAEMKTLNIKGDTFHPEWNYTISPRGAN
jgi:hypothetical protein